MGESSTYGDEWISDDSSFYGDEETQSRCRELDLDTFAAGHWQDNWVLQKRVSAAVKMSQMASAGKPQQLYNRQEGRPEARQLSETVAEFLKRLPPATTDPGAIGPWIWVENPHTPAEDRKNPDLARLGREGESLLQAYLAKRQKVESENQGKAKGVITRKLGPNRQKLKADIAQLALDTECTTGKWMFFPLQDDLPRFWRLVAEGVVDNRLGPTAKVATADTNGEMTRPRLICVYTKDFSDLEDVKRVLCELVRMDLVSTDSGRGIYYKCDAYTHLGIESSNQFSLQASLYSSRDMLK